MLTAIGKTIAEKAVELSIAGLIAAVGWGIWTNNEVRNLVHDQSATRERVHSNTVKINELVTEQRLTNERLAIIRDLLREMRDDVRRSSH